MLTRSHTQAGGESAAHATAGKGGAVLVAGLVIVALIAVALVLAGCESPAAQRLRAEADKEEAEAWAYQTRQEADTKAAAERAAIREAARQAGHERALELLPYVAVIVGALLLAGLGGMVFWDLRATRQAQGTGTDPAILLELRRLELAQAERDRAMWRALAELSRRRLTEGSGPVIVYGDGGRR